MPNMPPTVLLPPPTPKATTQTGTPNNLRKLRQTSSYRRYYSGADVSIYFGDVLMDESASIQFQMSENALPLYGYPRFAMKRVARGTRIVQGSFTLNFTDPEEIYLVLGRMANGDPSDNVTRLASAVKSVPAVSTYALAASSYQVTEDTLLHSTNVLETQKSLQDMYWGEVKRSVGISSAGTHSFNQPRLGAGVNSSNVQLSVEQLMGFPITIKYDKRELDMEMFEASIAAQISAVGGVKKIPVETITNVHLGTWSRSIDDSGQAIVSVYSFMASDVIPGWQEVPTRQPK